MDIKKYLQAKRLQVEQALEQNMLKAEGLLAGHMESMRYSLFAGGKRVRPILCIAATEALGGNAEPVLPLACAFECIHTYSLIHDDLPAMDNDDLRRGKLTCHKVFGEAEAILAGDGLLTYGFELLARPDNTSLPPNDRLKIIHLVARAIGSLGMVGGQALDMASEGKTIPFETLRYLHSCKTGALITAAVQTGAILGKASTKQYKAMTSYGENIGLAFQIKDDLLNIEATTEQLGKATGSDAELEKATYPSFFGVEKTRKKAKQAVENAISVLDIFDHKSDPLRELAKYIYERSR